MPETKQQRETININNVEYFKDTLSNPAKGLIDAIDRIQTRITAMQFDVQIATLGKDKLIDELVAEVMETAEVVPGQEQAEQTEQTEGE